jgi:uncharacterized protein YndB with AHSA1/START domain
MKDGNKGGGLGEYAQIEPPRKLVYTRRLLGHPTLGDRETTITYQLAPIPGGTRLTVRDEGFIGRSEAAYGNADHWERVLSWLESYFNSGTAIR